MKNPDISEGDKYALLTKHLEDYGQQFNKSLDPLFVDSMEIRNQNNKHVLDSTPGIGKNHIHGKVQFVEEKEIFYNKIIEPYNVKAKSFGLDLIEESLILLVQIVINY